MYSAGSFSPKISVPLLYVNSFRLTIGFEPLVMPSSPSVLGRGLRSVVMLTNMDQLADQSNVVVMRGMLLPLFPHGHCTKGQCAIVDQEKGMHSSAIPHGHDNGMT